MLELLYWNTQLMLLIGELAVMLLVIVLPTLWAIGAVLEFVEKIRKRRLINTFYKVRKNDKDWYKNYVKFLDKDKRKDK